MPANPRQRGVLAYLLGIMSWVFISSITAPSAHADSYRLQPNAYLYSCPFYHQDQAHFDALLNTAKAQLSIKIEGNRECAAKLSRVISNLDAISLSFRNVDPDLAARTQVEVMTRYLNDLQAQKAQLEAIGDTSSYAYTNIVSALFTVQLELLSNESARRYNATFARDYRESTFRQSMYQTMSDLVVSLKSTDPLCLSQMGGWDTVLPAVLGVSSLAAGYSAFAGQAVVSAALAITANISDLLRGGEAKAALARINDFQNAQILECTYYAMKYGACELRRAFRLSRDAGKIRDLIQRKYQDGVEADWERLYRFLEGSSQFTEVYEKVAAMGTPITMDAALLNEYISALQLSPFTMPPLPDDANATTKQVWLSQVKNRGVRTQEIDPFSGKTRPVDEVVADAKLQIVAAQNKIRAVEAIIRKDQSFVDLRAELDRLNGKLVHDVRDLKKLIQKYIALGVPEDPAAAGDDLLASGAGSMAVIVDVLTKLEDFLAVRYGRVSADDVCAWKTSSLFAENPRCATEMNAEKLYREQINAKGSALFEAMAQGAVAQITKQSVLAIGSKIVDRQARALQIIQNYFLSQDIQGMRSAAGQSGRGFADFIRDRALYAKIVDHYEQYQGPGKTNRVESINTALLNFEDGFEEEIFGALERSMQESSSYLPDLDGTTGAHLCSLFATALQRKAAARAYFGSNRAARLLQLCQKKYTQLELLELPSENDGKNLTGPKEIEINWGDPCFYPDYGREFEIQRLILDRQKHERGIPAQATVAAPKLK